MTMSASSLVSVRMPALLKARVLVMAAEEERSFSDQVRRLIEHGLDARPGAPAHPMDARRPTRTR
jgi:hypothetical protein